MALADFRANRGQCAGGGARARASISETLEAGGVQQEDSWRSMPSIDSIGFRNGQNLGDAFVPNRHPVVRRALVWGSLGSIIIGRMSPATGAGFFVAGLAVLLLLLRSRLPGRAALFGSLSGALGCVLLLTGLPFIAAYLHGSPLLYGQGATAPMALTTALAFVLLSFATIGAAG